MSRNQSLFRTQTKGLLLRTWHYQRRQHCNSVCNILIPPLFMLLLYVLGRTIKARDTQTLPFERQPKGAFAPRPFDPAKCIEIAREIGIEAAIRRCGAEQFKPEPQYQVPVYIPDQLKEQAGSRDELASSNQGLLGKLSLEPFIFPGALPSDTSGFYDSQTPYDGNFLWAYFRGNKSNEAYKALLQAEETDQIDRLYGAKTIEMSSKEALHDDLYNSWFKGSVYPLYSTALTFDQISNTQDRLDVKATVYFNESTKANCSIACPLVSNVVRMDNAIFQFFQPGKSAMAFLRRMPAIDVEVDLAIIQLVISITLGFTSHFWFPSFLRFLVFERTSRLRSMMSMMGLKRTQYFFGTYVGLFIQYAWSILFVIVIGSAVGIQFFVDNTPISYIFLFFLWGNVLIAFALAFVPFFGNPETAQTVGWLFILLVNIVGGPYLGRRLSDDNTSEGTWSAIMLLPSFAFLRSVYYAGALNSGGKGVVVGSEIYNGRELGMCQGNGPFCRSYVFLSVQWIILMIAAAYFDRVLPSAVGNRLHPLFCFGFKRKAKYIDSGDEEESGKGPDVREEEQRAANLVENMPTDPFDGVVLHKLSKTYPGRPAVRALRDLSIVARKNEVLCILAHNGAGKTTAFRTLVGELEPTAGTAFVNGNSILNEMDQVHRSMGVAPQQNILWDVMSVQEHLFFYGRVKNLSGQELKDAVEYALESVQLTFARKRKVKALSGGMKRRLSVSIAMIGRPNFIILDEPSTGLDILAREKLWESIEKSKNDKAIMLTTHSLEEAEALSDRVAIMSYGELKCIGKAEELKLRFGRGHHFSVSLPSHKVAELHDAITAIAPGATIETQLGGNIEYVLPKSFRIPDIFSLMQEKRDALEIRDWSINQSTLEDVFLEVTQRNDPENVKEDGIVAP